jgi:hypothetical protein
MKHKIAAIFITTVTGIVLISVAGYCYNVAVCTAYIEEVAADNQFISGQIKSDLDLRLVPPELVCDHYLDRDLAVHNVKRGNPPPPESVKLNDREYKIAKDCYLPNDISRMEYQRLKRELAAIYLKGNYGRPNITIMKEE